MTKNFVFGVLNLLVKGMFTIVACYFLIYATKTAFKAGYTLMEKAPKSEEMVVNVDLVIPEGSSTETIANILKESDLIGNTLYFRIMAKFSGNDGMFQYGNYTFNTGMDEDDIMKMLLTEGEKRETVTFTIPEGLTVAQVAQKLGAEGVCNAQDFLDAVYEASFGYQFIQQIPVDRNIKLQGYLFPDTYEVYKDSTAKDIVSTMLKQFDTVFKPEYYVQAEKLGYSMDEIITIASIIEREVKVDTERATVAGVIYNRLEIDMKLEMCSTVMYALDVPKERLLLTDLQTESPYNTYLYGGLPIGPIANPGEASIIAALYPEENDYLFFVLVDDLTGAHEFNTSLDSHNAAKKKHNEKF